MSYLHNFNIGTPANRYQTPLTIDQIARYAPSAMATARRIRRVSTRQVKGIDQDVKLNRALWQLAERMQELKAA